MFRVFKRWKPEKAETSDTGSFVTVLAMLLLLATAARLLAIDLERWRAAQTLSERASTVSSSGSLTGITAEHTRWTVSSDEYVLLFPIAAATAAADMAFWRAVASAGQRDGHAVQFVGVCDSGDRCAIPHGSPTIATLSYMDPFQMRANAIARRESRALLYHGQRLSASVVVTTDPHGVAAAIAREVEKEAEKGVEG
jgi:hypothetical protein